MKAIRYILPLLLVVSPVGWSQIDPQTQLTLDDLRTFSEVFARVQRDYVEETSDHDLLENAIRGMLIDLDPHTAFLNREEYEALSADTSGEYGGVGIEVLWVANELKVSNVMPDGPAQRAGVQPGEYIVAIDGTPLSELDAADALGRVRGTPGSEVVLSLAPEDGSKPRDVRLTREVIAVVSVAERLIDRRFGYIDVISFQNDTAEEVSAALDRLKAQAESELSGLVLDLRGNVGGVLGAAVGMADLFLREGLIVSTRGRTPESQLTFTAGPDDELAGAPIVVLVDELTASASEIVAGALQDHARAVILGGKTFGKGSVQTVMPLYNGGAIKLTTARYYTPAGNSIQAVGINPDIDITGDTFANVEQPLIREKDLSGSLSPAESAAAVATVRELAGDDYALYRALSLLRGYGILGKLDR